MQATSAGHASPLPSGRQYRLEHRRQRATVVEVGGALREYVVDGFPILDGFAEDQMATAARGQPLIPWPNRLADGRYEFEGRDLQLPLSEPFLQNAIHGLVRWNAWDLVDRSESRVRLGHVLWPQAGYPFTVALELEYELTDDGLRVTIVAENLGRHRAPYGAGQHPYLRVEHGMVNESALLLPAETWFETDERQIPTGRLQSVEGTDLDFRKPRQIGALRIDTAFNGLLRDSDGLARIELSQRSGGRRVTMWLDQGFDYVMAFTGDTLDGDERRRSVAIEPMTCAPDAFHNGIGLVVLDPGARHSATWGLMATH